MDAGNKTPAKLRFLAGFPGNERFREFHQAQHPPPAVARVSPRNARR